MSQAMTDAITALTAEVQAETNATQSAITLLNGLTQKINDLIANGTDDSATVQQIKDLTTAAQAQTDALASAVTANTPAQTPPAA